MVMALNHYAKGVAKLASILIGMGVGYVIALAFGMVDFSDIGSAAWFALPQFMHFGVKFDFAACVALSILFAINSIQAIGDFTATTAGGLDRDPTDNELQGGIIGYGISNILAALFGGLPVATYSQNVGIVTTNQVINRTVFALTGGFLLFAGVSPKFAAVLTTIPQCVLGGATITVFSTIAMTGMKLIASHGDGGEDRDGGTAQDALGNGGQHRCKLGRDAGKEQEATGEGKDGAVDDLIGGDDAHVLGVSRHRQTAEEGR